MRLLVIGLVMLASLSSTAAPLSLPQAGNRIRGVVDKFANTHIVSVDAGPRTHSAILDCRRETAPDPFLYFGARYYDPRTSVWLSTDPLLLEDQNPDRMPAILSVYAYAGLNPVVLLDPDGRDVYTFTWVQGADMEKHPYGHFAIGVTEYKPGTKEPTGRLRIYSWRPANPPNTEGEARGRLAGRKDVSGLPTIAVEDVETFKDVDNQMGVVADGIVRIKTTFEKDQELEASIKKEIEDRKTVYSAFGFNCVDACQLPVLGVDEKSLTEQIRRYFFFRREVSTPSKAHEAAKKVPGATAIRDPEKGRGTTMQKVAEEVH